MSKRILVVEDQEDNRRILRDILGSAGYELIEAESGEEAITAPYTSIHIRATNGDRVELRASLKLCSKCSRTRPIGSSGSDWKRGRYRNGFTVQSPKPV